MSVYFLALKSKFGIFKPIFKFLLYHSSAKQSGVTLDNTRAYLLLYVGAPLSPSSSPPWTQLLLLLFSLLDFLFCATRHISSLLAGLDPSLAIPSCTVGTGSSYETPTGLRQNSTGRYYYQPVGLTSCVCSKCFSNNPWVRTSLRR